jgi:hypothetical protein
VTFNVCPYPVTNNAKRRSLCFTTFSSWLLSSPSSKILIHMPPEIFDPHRELLPLLETLFGPNRLLFSRLLDTDEKGIPYIDDFFHQGFDLSASDLVCWINGDIIIPKGWFPRIRFVYERFSRVNSQFAVLCRRCDFNATLDTFYNSVLEWVSSGTTVPLTNYSFEYRADEDCFAPGFDPRAWPPNFDALAATRALHTTWGMDCFVISKNAVDLNFDDMPPFHMGRYRWDPWIAGWLGAQVPVVTLGDDFCTYHVDHTPTLRDVSRPKVRENIEMAARCFRYLASNEDSRFYFSGRHFHEQGVARGEPIPDSIPKGNAPPGDK